jgi:hypothetical protein
MKKTISIIGGGPASMLLAAFLNTEKYKVTIYEKNKTAGRKFLVAGKGGFNLTHSEPISNLIERYTPSKFLKDALINFTNNDFSKWLKTLEIPTFIGSSKRVYPEAGIKPITVLNAIVMHLKERGIQFKFNHRFHGWDTENNPLINNKSVISNYSVFSLGGGSWKVTGSDGNWLEEFKKKGIETLPFEASNCAFIIDWNPKFIKQNEGIPLKNIAISCSEKRQLGEVVITNKGLEGNAIYGLSPQIRKELDAYKKASIYIDFKPTLSLASIHSKIINSNFKNTTQILKKDLKLTATQIELLKVKLTKESYLSAKLLSGHIKQLHLEITATGLLDEAISTAGGVSLNAIDAHYQLLKIPNQFCIGEMLNWDAPTGGYLLQACASGGVYLSKHLNKID